MNGNIEEAARKYAEPILYPDGEILSDLYLIGSGSVNKEVAKHIVRIHNSTITN